MRRDELRQPLRKRSPAERLWARRPGLLVCAYAAAAVSFAAVGIWAVMQPMPFAGEPVVTLSVPPVEDIKTASTEPLPDEQQVDEGAEPENTADQPAATVEEPVNQDTYESNGAIVVSPRRALTPAPQMKVTEITSWGPLPRISKSGERPSRVYARSTSLNVIHSDAPKIAILLGGMGLNANLTTKAIAELPSDISLAFAPYGSNLQKQVDEARSEGHEVLLQVPLEPVGYPATNPGPRTLLGDGAEADNIDALRWHMARFSGYSGVVNYMGGRFLSMPKALKPLLSELKNRGLLFVEDGSLALSSTETTAKAANAQVRRAKIVIDTDPSPQAITAALSLLEDEARKNGMAFGTGSGLEVTIDVLRDWTRDAIERGIVLVPVTATFKDRLG